jgi:hypothetical protein
MQKRGRPDAFKSVPEASSAPLAEHRPEIIHVPYQRIFFDWDLADGTYTPEQLRKAKMVVKPWGAVQTYALVLEEKR